MIFTGESATYFLNESISCVVYKMSGYNEKDLLCFLTLQGDILDCLVLELLILLPSQKKKKLGKVGIGNVWPKKCYKNNLIMKTAADVFFINSLISQLTLINQQQFFFFFK